MSKEKLTAKICSIVQNRTKSVYNKAVAEYVAETLLAELVTKATSGGTFDEAIIAPPLHPHCRCAIVPVLKDEYALPGHVGAIPAELTPQPKPKPPIPKPPKPPKPQKPPKPVKPEQTVIPVTHPVVSPPKKWENQKDLATVASHFKEVFGMGAEFDAFSEEKGAYTTLQCANMIGSEYARMRDEFPKLFEKMKKSNSGMLGENFNLCFVKNARGYDGKYQDGESGGNYKTWKLNYNKKNEIDVSMDHYLTKGYKPTEGVANVAPSAFCVDNNITGLARHEFGHFFAAEIDSFADNSYKWGIIASDESHLISTYAKTNHQEAFAEAFNAYTSKDYKRGMLPPKTEAWMDKRLNHYRAQPEEHVELKPPQPALPSSKPIPAQSKDEIKSYSTQIG